MRFWGRRDAEIEAEIGSHLEEAVRERVERGESLHEARVNALREFGNVGLVKEVTREMWGWTTIEQLGQDVRYGLRMLLKHKGVTLVAIFSLALGIGANTAIFSLIDAVLLRMLPVERPEQLYFVQNVGPQRLSGGAPPYPCFERFCERGKSFAGLAAFAQRSFIVNVDGAREEVTGQFVSGNYFSLLGINPSLGRSLGPADDAVPEKGGPDGYVGVISHDFWSRRFGRNPEVIGKVVRIGNDPVTIVGVAPPEFHGLNPGVQIDISIPMMFQGAKSLADKNSWWFQAVGRLKPDASVEQARVELDTIFQSFMDETSISAEARRNTFARIELVPASKGLDTLRRQFSRPLQTLMVIVALVLLISCANVANLLLARAAARQKEFAVRLGLGASRVRLLRQMLTESMLLVFVGGLLGLVFARWGGFFLMSFFANGRDRVSVDLGLDHRVLLFTAGVSLLTGIIFGLVPALRATHVNPAPALKDGAATNTRLRARFGKSLVVAQVALSMLLLVAAGLFLQTLRNLKNIDAGFRREGVVTMRVNPSAQAYRDERLANLWKEIVRRVASLPDVNSASLSSLYPLDGNERAVKVDVAGFNADSEADKDIRLNQVSPGFFPTFGIGLVQGRAFTESDTQTSAKVAVLNEAAARFYFADRDPVGGQLSFKRDPKKDALRYQIVGVVRDSRYQNLRAPDTRMVYLPMQQSLDQMGRLVLAVHGDGRSSTLIDRVRNEIRAAGPDILLTNIATLDEQVDQSLLQERLVATLSVFFGLLALVLACIGLYGVMSYDVARRTREIGIRMALGANAARVARLVLGQTMTWVTLGLLIGLGAALVTTRWVESLLFGLKANDLFTVGVAALILLLVAAFAGYLPARRAAKVNPLVALRRE